MVKEMHPIGFVFLCYGLKEYHFILLSVLNAVLCLYRDNLPYVVVFAFPKVLPALAICCFISFIHAKGGQNNAV